MPTVATFLRNNAIYSRTLLHSCVITTPEISLFPSGILAVRKPLSWTSNDVVAKVKNIILSGLREEKGGMTVNRNAIRVGHGGTLDPMAEGVLVLGINKGTKLMKSYLEGTKEYCAVGKLGIATDTFDATGKVVFEKQFSNIGNEIIEKSLQTFIGDIYQTPPMFSALKVNGKRLYQYAREGLSVDRQPRKVQVYDIKLKDPQNRTSSDKEFELVIQCGGGFYVRTLINDLGEKLDTHAHMVSLIRTKQGPFNLDDCLQIEDWNLNKIRSSLVPIESLNGVNPDSSLCTR